MMKKIILSLVSLMSLAFTTLAENVNIPDANFKTALLNQLEINTVDDGEISYEEAAAVIGILDVHDKNISSLVGLEAFVNITEFYCYHNTITTLDVSQNTKLEIIGCNYNQLTSVDITKNLALTVFNPAHNLLTSIDVSKNVNLTELYVESNDLSDLDLSKNLLLNVFNSFGNPNLTCVGALDTQNKDNWMIDFPAYFDKSCAFVNIPDDNFRAALLNNFDINTTDDGKISYAEAEALVGTIDVHDQNISSLVGLEAFKNITEFYCYYNNISTLDVSNNTALSIIGCNYNALTSVVFGANDNLEVFNAAHNQLTTIDVSMNSALDSLYLEDNLLTSLDVSSNGSLTYLNCNTNELTALDVSNNTLLDHFDCSLNANLTCIGALDAQNKDNWMKDFEAVYSEDCSAITATNNTTIALTKSVVNTYNLQGQAVNNTYQGFVIIKYTDGSTLKTIQ
ncbi:MAG: hypothetical protein RL711_1422 [Bacteroidota bacterium]